LLVSQFRSSARPGRGIAVAVVFSALLAGVCGPAAARETGADPRARAIDCEAVVQATYWDLRNEGQAGAFPLERYRATLADRAERTAREVAYLRAQRGRDFTAGELQAEVDRMARDTKSPAALGKLFAALGNDPRRVAECLAKPALADQLARQYFAEDSALHAATELAALDALAGAQSAKAAPAGNDALVAPLIAAGLDARAANPARSDAERAAVRLLREFNVAQWQVAPKDARTRWSPLLETGTGYRALRGDYVDGKLQLRTLRWPKRDFDGWWSEASTHFAPDYAGKADASLVLPQLASGEIAHWSPMRDHDDFTLRAEQHHGLVVATGSEVIAWGDHGQRAAAYDPVTDAWRLVSGVGAPAYDCGGLRGVWTGTRLLVVAGQCTVSPPDSASEPTSQPAQAALYDPVADTWQAIAAPPASWRPADGFSVVWTGRSAIFYGGYLADGEFMGPSLGTGAMYDTVTHAWTGFTVNPAQVGGATTAVQSHQAVWTGSTMLVFTAGADYRECDGTAPSGFAFSPYTGVGAALPPRPATANAGFGRVHWTGSQVIVYGPTNWADCDGSWGPRRGALRYTPATNAWSLMSDAGDPQSTGASVWAGDKRLVVWSGWSDADVEVTDTGAIYRTDTNTWTPMSTAGAPHARQDHFAARVGSGIVFLGGTCDEDGNACGDGGRFDPAANTWRGAALPPAPNGPPQAFAGSPVAGSGTELYVWGAADARIYDSVTDLWTPIALAGSPGPRTLGLGFYANGRFHVFGGLGPGYVPTGTGAAYDPVARTWTPMPAPPLNLAREGTALAWDGSRMIAWGGRVAGADRASGATFNPATNTWTQMVAANAPGARAFARVVAEAGKTFVWRGSTGGQYGAAAPGGAIYDASANQWTAVPDNGSLPADPYNAHDSVVWLGTGWGVLSGGKALYRLANAGTGQWTALGSDGAPPYPADNNERSALWTGKNLLVWGNPYDTNGWLYRPDADTWMQPPREHQPDAASAPAAMVRVGAATAVWGGSYGETTRGSFWLEDTRTGPLSTDLGLAASVAGPVEFFSTPLSLVVTNHGSQIATGVVVKLEVDEVTLSGFEEGQACETDNRDTTCYIDSLAPGESREVRISVDGRQAVASVQATEADPDPSNNARTLTFPTLTFADAEVVEGDSGTSQLVFVATLSEAGTFPVTFDVGFRTSPNGASPGVDFDATPQTGVTIPAGQLSKLVSVPVSGDTTIEQPERLELLISNVLGGELGWNEVPEGWIINDDGPLLNIGDASVVEGDSGTKNMVFTVTLSEPVDHEVYFSAGLSNLHPGTTDADDYLGYTGGNGMPAGATSKQVAIAIKGDNLVEADEYFYFVIGTSADSGATVLDGIGKGTILNDDGPTLSIADAAITEGDSGTKQLTFTATLSQASPATTTFDAATVDGTATAGSDYLALAATGLDIPSGQLTRSFSVTLNGDTAIESGENFRVVLSNANGAVLGDAQATGTITNDDGLRIADASVSEGHAGTKQLSFTVSLPQALANAVTFNAATQGSTATSNVDYAALPATAFAIPAGQLTTSVQVTINGDTVIEGNETFKVVLSSVVGAPVLDAQGVGTITNDDVNGLRIDDVAIAEGNAGTKLLTFTVSLAQPLAGDVTFNANTQGGTATVGNDFVGTGLTAYTLPAGQLTRTIAVTINGDTVVEANEAFIVNLSAAVGAPLLDSQGVGTITNDDVVGLKVGDATVTEGDSGTKVMTFVATLTQAAPGTVTFNANTQGGTATTGSDFVGFGGPQPFSIAAGQLSRNIAVTIVGDTTVEADEALTLVLSAASGATLQDAQGVGTIANDD
jgi:hypothetical protein